MTRPLPRARGSSVCVMTPSSTNASWARTCDCWWLGKTSMMRLIASAAELVCSVANTRWPVSAMVRAAWMVSRSRISPMRMTSGSSRRAYLSAFAKLWVSVPTSRWLTMQAWCRWMNSMGSSTVMMWPFRSRLTLSIMAASVVDLPEPVGPVTSTSPRGFSAMRATTAGRPRSWKVRMLNGNLPDGQRDAAALLEAVAAEAREVLDAEREVELVLHLEALLLVLGQHRVGNLERVLGRQHGLDAAN